MEQRDRPILAINIAPDGTVTARKTTLSELDPATAKEVREIEATRGRWLHDARASLKRGWPDIAIAEAPLAERAVARIIRDKNTRLVVLSADRLEDEYLSSAVSMFHHDETHHPELEGSRTIDGIGRVRLLPGPKS